jgi:hypothetical protein
MLPRELQALLGKIYGLEIEADVADYIVTDQDYLRAVLGADICADSVEESLLILEEEDVLDIALYLDADMLTRVSNTEPGDSLYRHNLDDFCKVLEGVSHFVYLAWNAGKDKSVTRLELEMQAEIDKYISSRLLLESQQAGASGLLSALFEDVQYAAHLKPDALERYRHANDAASRYCHNLEQRFPSAPTGGPSISMLHELRAFYRMPQPDKISHIHAAQFA